LIGRTDMISFSVTDTGIGIAPDKLAAVFEAFQQADGSTKRKYGGTGLGLSISKQIAGMLGGELTLTSEVGVGSVFTLTIPETHVDVEMDEHEAGSSLEPQAPHAAPKPVAVAVAPAPIQAPTPQREPVLKETVATPEPVVPVSAPISAEAVVRLVIEEIPDDRSSIEKGDKVMLIVEDDPTFARLLLDFSRERGYKGIVALQGDRALQVAKQYKPTAILMDNMLPVMDGMSVMDKLKEDSELRHIPVHFMSAIDMKKQSMKNGAIGYLMKPKQ
jgi:CheY-like chemotaxis protein